MDKETKLRQDIGNLCVEFGFIKHKENIINLIFSTWRLKQGTDISKEKIEIVKLILLLRQCKKDIEIEGIASYQDRDIIKGQLLKLNLSSGFLISNIEYWLNTLLNERIGANYENLGITYKEINESGDYDKYTNKELYEILEIENVEKERRDLYSPLNKNPYYGAILSRWHKKINTDNDFSNDGKISDRKCYLFLYKCMVLIGEFSENENLLDSDKSIKVRDCIKAYKKRIGLLD